MKAYNTRLAPSPTGRMHVGTARTGLFNWLAAKASGGKFILRIDDTDSNRNDESTVKPIYDGLDWLGIKWDYTFRQSSNQDAYKRLANQLVENDFAATLENGAISLKWHKDMPRMWHDNIAGDIPITDTNIEQIDGRTILLKGDESGNASTYQFSSVVDDWTHDVNYIIRGTDHITNSAKQLCIWWALNQCHDMSVEFPEMAHIGLIFKDGKKLSKRDGASGIEFYKEQGYLPEAVFAFLLRLGWSPRVDDKDSYTMSPEQSIEQFLTHGRMRNSNAQLDLKKLDSIQKKFMSRLAKQAA